MTERERHRTEVERLLDVIRDRVSELRLLKTYGVRVAIVDERKRELARARQQLAAIVVGVPGPGTRLSPNEARGETGAWPSH